MKGKGQIGQLAKQSHGLATNAICMHTSYPTHVKPPQPPPPPPPLLTRGIQHILNA